MHVNFSLFCVVEDYRSSVNSEGKVWNVFSFLSVVEIPKYQSLRKTESGD